MNQLYPRMRVKAERQLFNDAIKVLIFQKLKDDEYGVISDIVITTRKAGEYIPESEGILFTMESAQELMDELWLCGIRPNEGTGSAGSLAATQNHLKNIQQIADRLLTMIERDKNK